MNEGFLARDQFQCLFDALLDQGYTLLGPTIQQEAIVYDSVAKVDQLPIGMVDIQEPGSYKLQQTESDHHFSWATAAQSLKPLCFAPNETLWQSSKASDGKISFSDTLEEFNPIAVIGAKACDLAALKLQDKHFLQQEYVDPYYQRRRKALFIVSVDCNNPASTCFCHSTGDGPSVDTSALTVMDINLTELDDGFIVLASSERAVTILEALPLSTLNKEQLEQKKQQHQISIDKQTRSLPACDISQTLKNRQEHTHWDDIGQRCLACGNCTAVCPSCFCHSETDESALNSNQVSHTRQWDSCFNQNHSYIHGIIIRPESRSRYRQWMTHKFSSWYEQYGRSGCTGCGRCISWCPVGIDVTQELEVICNEVESNLGKKDND